MGAGASAEAGIPTAAKMIGNIESLLKSPGGWGRFRDLYNHVKSAIYYSAGLKGFFNEAVPYNIETLVNTLYELERNEEHPLYPFIASWNSRFVVHAKADFSAVKDFRRMILRELKKWMCPDDTSRGDYFRGFIRLQGALNFPLRIFTLNYDRCIERLNSTEFRVETGFEDFGPEHIWDYERFEFSESGPNPLPGILLYKLHGSVNWKRDEATKCLYCVEQVESVESEQMEVIFGRDFKLEAADPYLFYAYEFRRFALSARLIVIIGYGFGDAHINKMLTQALREDSDRRLLVVSKCVEEGEIKNKSEKVREFLDVNANQIIVEPGTAKSFLEQQSVDEKLIELIPETKDSPF